MITLTLPWPSKDLSPNARVHWSRKAKATKCARQLAVLAAFQAGWKGLQLPEGRLHLWLDFYPPTRQMPDDDNMLGRCKAYRDGLAHVLGIDDQRFISHPLVRAEPRKGGEVVSSSPARARTCTHEPTHNRWRRAGGHQPRNC
ncbi:RusA family crossover junction endodeoxyribonuclease [Xanthomonas perforans]|uniref:hypothetical protein n=1 Tax=Xanthomonas perforans TaxID=442694 RepID=UPI001F2B64EC|nr:hypothetical protein [Xanthomonas perforans]MDC9651496.1 hypothetical protein [Xanthomonas perforans]MDC9658303.1 hypothetical protein [Xanthomonas perforans]MDC9679086.1 hypothetical protein [Xanthomonas perforans]MDC9680003.1 hypothetical protein [Xanthomonas perforans]MDC9684218.1 hypothetical protein [Xanthomonas perforans]